MSIQRSAPLCLLAFLICTLFPGCRTGGSSQVLLDTDIAFARTAAIKGAAAAFRDYAAQEAMVLPQGALPVVGRENIYQDMLPDTGKLEWAPRGADISSALDLGYTWGEYQYYPVVTNNPAVVRHGKYLTIWKRQRDGTWKFVVDTGNSNPTQPTKKP